MFLRHIRHIIENKAENPVDAKNVAESTLVLTCPSWFQDSQRRRLQDAAQIAGWKRATVINDTAAVAFANIFANGYRLYTSLDNPKPVGDDGVVPPPVAPRRIAYVDLGHSTFVCSIVEYIKVLVEGPSGPTVRLDVNFKATVSDRNFGGRDFDRAIVEHFNGQFESKFEPGALRKNVKAQSRLYTAANKLRTMLSVNSSAPLNVECIYDDKDVSGVLSRAEFETLIEPYTARVPDLLAQCLAMSKLKVEDIDSIEVIGGASRTAVVKAAVANFFQQDLSYTLNMEETASSGAAFFSASLSPTVKLVPIAVHDITQYPIRFVWERTADLPDKDTELRVYEVGKPYPSSKVVTFYRKQDFSFSVEYAVSAHGPGPVTGVKKYIAQYQITGITPPAGRDDFVTCKLRVKLDDHGIFSISEAYALEDADAEDGSADSEDSRAGKGKKEARKVPLTVTVISQSLPDAELQVLRAAENHMDDTDTKALELDNLRNSFEETILNFDSYLSGSVSIPEAKKDELRSFLRKNEDWLYDYDGDNLHRDLSARMAEVKAQWDKYNVSPAKVDGADLD